MDVTWGKTQTEDERRGYVARPFPVVRDNLVPTFHVTYYVVLSNSKSQLKKIEQPDTQQCFLQINSELENARPFCPWEWQGSRWTREKAKNNNVMLPSFLPRFLIWTTSNSQQAKKRKESALFSQTDRERELFRFENWHSVSLAHGSTPARSLSLSPSRTDRVNQNNCCAAAVAGVNSGARMMNIRTQSKRPLL